MLKEKTNKALICISTKDEIFIEQTLVGNDTKEKLDDTIKYLYKTLRIEDKDIEDFDVYFKPESNINEDTMIDNELYCMTYTRNNGEDVVIINKSRKQILNRIRTLKLSLQAEAYNGASLFRMRDAINSNEILDKYSDALVDIRKELV